MLAIYNAPKSVDNIDNLRYTQFVKSTKLNKPVQLSNLPPTSAATHQHINRVYYQIQTWLGNDLEPQEWGWVMRIELLEPIMTILPTTSSKRTTQHNILQLQEWLWFALRMQEIGIAMLFSLWPV